MADIADWLKSRALERYARKFQRAEIDLETLAELTDDDLKELGLPLGPRRKILAALRGEKLSKSRAERRHVTVLFADLVGSTAIASTIDPEAMAALLAEYQHVVSEEIERYGGYVAKFMGDGVMAYFGWPRAQEDAAERSVRAGLGIACAVSRLTEPDARHLHARVGIATGNVVIGEIVGTGATYEAAIAGDTPHLAARLQTVAQPDEVLISDATHRMVGTLFESRCMDSLTLKGFSEPVNAWCVEREAVDVSRFAAVRAMRSGLVGRDGELALLLEGWKSAISGHGGAFVISGDAGIGKSRLVEALSSADTGAARKIRLQCSTLRSTSALFPLGRYVEHAAGFLAEDSAAAKRKRLNELFSEVSGSSTLVPLASQMLSLTDVPTELALTPAQRKASLIAGLVTWIAELSSERPVLLVLEDAHWSDATTLEWMTRMIAGVGALHQMLVVTARTGFASPWSGQPDVTQLPLGRLNAVDCERIVAAILPEVLRKTGVFEEIVSKSDGNPLFLEELALGSLVAGKCLPIVPDTLEDSLMARLDQLGRAKTLAQQASVLGRRFDRRLLDFISPVAASALDEELTDLVAAGVVYPIGRAGDGNYEFKHALMRDAAYESLLHAERRRLHGDAAAALEAHFSEVVDNEPELLAYHFAGAENAPRAAFYYERTGDRATARFAYAEAIQSFNSALTEVAHFPSGVENDRNELKLSLKLGTALSVMHGPHNADAGAAFSRAAEIAQSVGDERSLFEAIWGMWYHYITRELDAARDRARELIALGERSGDENYILEAAHCHWSTAMFRGDYALAVSETQRGIDLYNPERHHHLAAKFGGHDPGVCAYVSGGICNAVYGRPAEAHSMGEQAVALADSLQHPHSIAHALLVAALSSACMRDVQGVRSYTPRLLAVAEKFNFLPQAAVGSFLSQIFLEHEPANLDSLTTDFLRARTMTPLPVMISALMAEYLIELGRVDEALDTVDGMLAELKVPNVGIYLSELHRMRGVALHALGRKEAAAAALDDALAIARSQGARLLELRTQCTRARFGEPAAEEDLRACIAEWPGNETCADLDAANALSATRYPAVAAD